MKPNLKRPLCPSCGERAEFYKTQIYCKKCARYFEHSVAPKVLVFDIETSRMEVDAFQMGKTVLRSHMIRKDWFMICWRARWLFDKKELGAVVTPTEAKNRDDKRVTKALLDVLRSADFAVTYNGNKFDIKKINWLFIKHRLTPIPYYGSIDVMRGIKEVAAPSSLSLDFVSQELGYGAKLETDHTLWGRAEQGDEKALEYMYEYNGVDVDKTEAVYLHVKPYLKNHPNFAEFLNYYQEVDPTLDVGAHNHRCPRCLSGVISKEKFVRYRQTPAGYFYKRANCPNCGAVVFEIKRPNGYKRNSQKVYVR